MRRDAQAGGATTEFAVSLRRLAITLGARRVVSDISFDVRRGEFLTLLGPSGCGKTSTLRAIAGYVFAAEGTIEVDGVNVTTLPPQKRSIGMVFQNYALFPHLTVYENIAFSLRLRGRTRSAIASRVKEMLDLVRLPEFGSRYPRQLSGGQQQRVAVARALAFQPRVLLLDEPLSALDRHLREELQGELKRIQRELGITTIFVTHDQGEALALSDRIAIMRAGMIEQLAPPSEIYEAPATKFVASFVGKMQFLPGTADRIEHRSALVRIDGFQSTLRCAAAAGLTAGQRCVVGIRPENVRVTTAGAATSSLEAVIHAVRYFGTHVVADLAVANGLTIQGVDFSRRARVGDRVSVEWQETGMVAFSMSEAALTAEEVA